MTKPYSTSGISILVQLSSWRSDDDFHPIDERVPLAVGAMTLLELIRAKRIVGIQEHGFYALEVVDTTPTGEFILDGVLQWLEVGYKQSTESFIREVAEMALLRTQTSLISQNVLIDMNGDLVILGQHQDMIRSSIKTRLFGGTQMQYAHDIFVSTIASIYNPNAALFFSLLGVGYDKNLVDDVFGRRSPVSDMEPSVRDAGNGVMASLYEVTRTS